MKIFNASWLDHVLDEMYSYGMINEDEKQRLLTDMSDEDKVTFGNSIFEDDDHLLYILYDSVRSEIALAVYREYEWLQYR